MRAHGIGPADHPMAETKRFLPRGPAVAAAKGWWILGVLLFLGGGCAAPTRPRPVDTVVWSGTIRVREDVRIPRGKRLVVEPGTRVVFAFRDDDGDGWGDASIRVEGDLVVRGTASAPVRFTPRDEPARPGRWGEIRVDFGTLDVRYAVIEGSTRGLHAHFCRGRIADSVFRWNVDGTRLGNSALRVERNLFYGHPGKAYNAHRCRNTVEANRFHHNRYGIFLFAEDLGSVFRGNWFRAHRTALRLGDFFAGAVRTSGNDWGGAPPGSPPDNPQARLTTAPAAVERAGPRAWPVWAPAWRADPGGFVDAPVLCAPEGVYAAAWGGSVVRLDGASGRTLDAAELPDVVDAGVAPGPEVLATQAWDRGVYLLGRPGLRVLDRFEESPSPADDHRQSRPVFAGRVLVVGTWAGRVRAFDTSQGVLRPLWTFEAGGPFRAPLARAAEAGIVLAPCQDGLLYALDERTGGVRWAHRGEGPFLAGVAVARGIVYAADRAGRLHAVDLGSGRPRWVRDLGAPVWYAAPLVAGGRVFQGDDSGRLHALDAATGRILWVRRLEGGIRARPVDTRGGLLVVPTLSGRVYLVEAGTGLERDAWMAGEASQSDPCAAGDRVVLGTRGAGVTGLRVLVF